MVIKLETCIAVSMATAVIWSSLSLKAQDKEAPTRYLHFSHFTKPTIDDVGYYPAIATRKPAATMGQVMRRKMKRLMYTPTVRMNTTVSKVNGTMIFPITVAAFGHFHLFKCLHLSIS